MKTKSIAITRSFNLRFAFCNCQFTLIFIAFCCFPALTFAQVVRLPAVLPEQKQNSFDASTDPSYFEQGNFGEKTVPPEFPGKLVFHPDSSAQILAPPGESIEPAMAEVPTRDVRSGFFQRAIFNGTWLPRTAGSSGFGQYNMETKLVVALPCPTTDSPMIITPGFGVHYLDGPANVDLPPRLFDCYTQFRWLSQVTPNWGLDLAVTPGWYSDFEQDSGEAFRMPAHAAAAWTLNPTTKLVFGAAYLARPDVDFIPVGGIIWMPDEDTNFELLFPEPKIARRIAHETSPSGTVNTWLYLSGEFAGDAWAVKMQDGANDRIVLRDCRVILGVERKKFQGFGAKLEIGYVFSRRIVHDGDTPDFYPSDTVLLRAGIQY